MCISHFSPDQIVATWKLKQQGEPWKVIAKKLDVDADALRKCYFNHVESGWLERHLNGEKRKTWSCLQKEELALAYELHVNGCSWRNIAEGLGVTIDYIKRRVRQVMREGLPS